VLLGNGDGTFQPHIDSATGNYSTRIAVADFNRDGKLDVVVGGAGTSSDTISLLAGKGDGTFGPNADYPTGPYPFAVAVGDLNGDGAPDVIVPSWLASTLSVLLNTGATQ